MKITEQIKQNRVLFLNELRSGKHKKGTIKSDEKGFPVIEKPEDEDGACACAIMGQMFGKTATGKVSLPTAAKALGLDNKTCGFIQREINDTPDDFNTIALRIEELVFKDKGVGMITLRGMKGEELTEKEGNILTEYINDFTKSGKKIYI